MKVFDWWRRPTERRERQQWAQNKWEATGWLDVSETDNPWVFGDVVTLRDSDGMGFALQLGKWRGAHVRVTIVREPTTEPQVWLTGER